MAQHQPHLPLDDFALPQVNLHEWDVIVLNTSGGKDSQTMLRQVVSLADEQGYPRDNLVMVHADLGRVEWEGTRELAQQQAEHYCIEFRAIARPQGDLLEHVEQRGMWPSPRARHCTSDHKRGQVGKIVTALHRERASRQRPESPSQRYGLSTQGDPLFFCAQN